MFESGFEIFDFFLAAIITIVSVLVGLLLHPVVRASNLGLDEPVDLPPHLLLLLLELVHAGEDVGLAELRRAVDVQLQVPACVRRAQAQVAPLPVVVVVAVGVVVVADDVDVFVVGVVRC